MNEGQGTLVDDVLGLPFDAVTAGEDHPDLGVDPLQPFEYLPTTHAGHDHIQNDQGDFAIPGAINLDGLGTRGSGDHSITKHPQNPPRHNEHHFLVVDQKDRFAAFFQLLRRPDFFILEGRLRRREVNRKNGARPSLGIHLDEPLMPFNNAVNGGQTQARAASHFLGRKKWIEDPFPGPFVHPNAGVPDGNLDVTSRNEVDIRCLCLIEQHIRRFKVEVTAAWHRLPSVQKKIQQDLLDLRTINVGDPEAVPVGAMNIQFPACAGKHI